MSVLLVLVDLIGRVVFSFLDPSIAESSGLVDRGDLMVTTNDSGGDAEVFVIDPRTGRTVGRTTYADEVRDVEALAPAGRDAVWVGDIGDNRAERDSVRVHRVPVGDRVRTVTAESYELVYPDGPHDAESLVTGADGRLYVITKALFGGTAYVAPARLDPERQNRLTAVGSVHVWATDAAVFPDGRHVLVRGYRDAAVYTFPGFRRVASFGLPQQRQGEGVSIGPSGRIRLSSEGVHSPVVEVDLPSDVRRQLAAAPTTEPADGDDAVAGQPPTRTDEPARPALSSALLAGGTLVVVAALGAWLVRRRRRG